jgi:hypothetical protein
MSEFRLLPFGQDEWQKKKRIVNPQGITTISKGLKGLNPFVSQRSQSLVFACLRRVSVDRPDFETALATTEKEFCIRTQSKIKSGSSEDSYKQIVRCSRMMVQPLKETDSYLVGLKAIPIERCWHSIARHQSRRRSLLLSAQLLSVARRNRPKNATTVSSSRRASSHE